MLKLAKVLGSSVTFKANLYYFSAAHLILRRKAFLNDSLVLGGTNATVVQASELQ
jgi:hypothetical protein